MAKDKIGILGGTFNPVHLGHVTSARRLRERLGLSRVIIIPSANPVHKPAPKLASAADRLEMCRIATENDPFLQVSDMEICRTEPSFTIITLQQLHDEASEEAEFFLILGSDNLPLLHSWRDISRIFDLCKIVTIERPGYPAGELDKIAPHLSAHQIQQLRSLWLPLPPIDISSSGIRRRVHDGESIGELVISGVADYIQAHGLYR